MTTAASREQTLEAFAAERGLITDADVQGHIHAGLRSAPTTKTYRRWNERRLAELQAARDATKRMYEAAIASGTVKPLLPSLERTAAGHPDNPSTQAAQRVIAKRAARAWPPASHDPRHPPLPSHPRPRPAVQCRRRRAHRLGPRDGAARCRGIAAYGRRVRHGGASRRGRDLDFG